MDQQYSLVQLCLVTSSPNSILDFLHSTGPISPTSHNPRQFLIPIFSQSLGATKGGPTNSLEQEIFAIPMSQSIKFRPPPFVTRLVIKEKKSMSLFVFFQGYFLLWFQPDGDVGVTSSLLRAKAFCSSPRKSETDACSGSLD